MANKETKKLNLSVEKIENHRFENVPRGYNALEVDKFLDLIILDYLAIEERELVDVKELKVAQATIDSLNKKIEELMVENNRLEKQVIELKKGKGVPVTPDNIAILSRINALEKYLYKQGIDPNKIK